MIGSRGYPSQSLTGAIPSCSVFGAGITMNRNIQADGFNSLAGQSSALQSFPRHEWIAGNHESQGLLDRFLDADTRRGRDPDRTVAVVGEPQVRAARGQVLVVV